MLHIALMSTHLKVLYSIVVAIAVDMVHLQFRIPIIEEMLGHNAVNGELLPDTILVSNELKVADFSSRGPIFDFIKPDLIAPGVGITATSNDTKFYRQMSGTSVSTPFVAGVAALLLQKNPLLLPNDIKTILLASTTKLPFDANECGAGLLNAKNSNIFVDKILNKTR